MGSQEKPNIKKIDARERRWEVMNFGEVFARGAQTGIIPVQIKPEAGWKIIAHDLVQTETGIDAVVIEVKDSSKLHGSLLCLLRADPLSRAGSNFYL